MDKAELVLLCREVDEETGKVIVYEIETEITDETLKYASFRSRFNNGLAYFTMLKSVYLSDKSKIEKMIRSKHFEEKIQKYGGIAKL